MLERGTNKVRLFNVADRTAAILLPILADNIEAGSIVISDRSAYRGIRTLQQQYNHRWINHRLYFVDPTDRQVHTQGIEAT
jgi:hypothetical protein